MPPEIVADTLWRRLRPLVHALRHPARARQRMDGGRHRGRLALHAAHLASGQRSGRTRWAPRPRPILSDPNRSRFAVPRIRLIASVEEDFDRLRFNVAVARVHAFANIFGEALSAGAGTGRCGDARSRLRARRGGVLPGGRDRTDDPVTLPRNAGSFSAEAASPRKPPGRSSIAPSSSRTRSRCRFRSTASRRRS